MTTPDAGAGIGDASFALPPTAEEHQPGQIIRHASALEGTVEVTLNMGGYLGTICIDGVCTSNGATGIYPLAEGVHHIVDNSASWHATNPTTSLGTLTVDTNGNISVSEPDTLLADNGPPNNPERTLTAQTAPIRMNMGGYGSPHVGFYWFTWGAPSVTLLKNRRYHLIDLSSGGPTGGYAFSSEPDVRIADSTAV